MAKKEKKKRKIDYGLLKVLLLAAVIFFLFLYGYFAV